MDFKIFSRFILLFTVIITLFVLSSSAAGLANSPQPKFQHDNQNTGESSYFGPQTNHIKWIYSTSQKKYIYTSGAIDSKGNIYFGCYDHKIYALSSTGKKKWTYTTGGIIKSTPSLGSDGIIYVGSMDRKFYAIYSYGRKKWTYTTGGSIIHSPVIGADGTIYLASLDKYFYALKPTGKLKWKIRTTGIISSPALDHNGNIWIGCSNKKLYSISPDKKIKYVLTLPSIICSSPTIGSDNTLYFCCVNKKVYALKNKKLLWKYNLSYPISSSLAVTSQGNIYFGSGHKLFCIKNGVKQWARDVGLNIKTPTIGKSGTIYFAAANRVFAVKNNSVKWSFKTGKILMGPPVIGNNGTLYFGSFDGKFYAIQDFGPDLYINQFSGPKVGYLGSDITFTDYVANNGKINITKKFYVYYYLSKTPQLNKNPIKIGSRYIYRLEPGQINSQTTTLKVSTNIVPGTYYLLALVNATYNIRESNLNNNLRFSTNIKKQIQSIQILKL